MERIIANLSFRQKFLALGLLLVLLVALPTIDMVRAALNDRAVLRAEKLGLDTSEVLLPLIKATQEHRGLSGAVLLGNVAMMPQRKDRQALVDQHLGQLAPMLAMHQSTRLDEAYAQIRKDWQALQADVSKGVLLPAQSLKRHNLLVKQEIHLLLDMSDASGLTLDSDPLCYHMIMAFLRDMPRATDMMGQARAKGMTMLIKRSEDMNDRLALRSFADGFLALHAEVIDGLERVVEASPGRKLDEGLAAQVERSKLEIARAGTAVQNMLEALGDQTPTPDAYYQAMTQAMTAQFELSQAGMNVLKQHLDARMSNGNRNLAVMLVLVVLMGALGAWVVLTIMRTTTRSLAEAVRVAQALAQGDLSQRLHSDSRDEVGQMVRAMGAAIEHMKGVIEGIKVASDSVATAAQQIAMGNQDLSARTEGQASSLQQTASSMEEMSATVTQNADTAARSRELATRMSDEAVQSGEIFHQVVSRMEAIKQTSAKIADINSVIDGIAFQTNILALNAAVEAARAGEQGRGFAVVASEVRSLAQRSAQAAREIKALIGQSVDSIEQGYSLAAGSTQAIERLVVQVKEVSHLISDIAMSSEQQSMGIAQVNQAVSQLDQGTQQNAALVEESSAAATSLSDQARRLQEAVGSFRLA